FTTLGERPIKHVHLIQQQRGRQSVRDGVMKVDDQDVFGFIELEQGNTDQRKTRQVERFDRFFRGKGLQSVFAFLAGQVREIRDGNFDLEVGMDELQGFSVLDREGGSQCLMALDNFIETVFQSRQIQRAFETV